MKRFRATFLIATAALVLFCATRGNAAAPVTFTREVAPILFARCAVCHRAGQSAPFELLTYADARKHAREIVELTQKRLMPPWLPEPGVVAFAGERILSVGQIETLRQWESAGAIEGAPGDLPPRPSWPGDWQLGPPDFVVRMPRAYTLPAEGRDVYRNFVLPVALPSTRLIRAMEFRFANKAVHHAFLGVDVTPASRRLEAQGSQPGFDGMEVSPTSASPDGHFLTWQPGKQATVESPGLAWRLPGPSDLVLQLHMQPTGRAEEIQAALGFYFTDQAPTNTPIKLALNSFNIDIPAGKKDYVVRDSYVLPIDAQVLRVKPHAHYLCRVMKGMATLPDGSTKWLLSIRDWDFKWQGDYEYAAPIFLPKGTTLSMEFTFDNSSDNPRNPHHPPVAVHYGSQTVDEMAELWFQLLPRHETDAQVFARDYQFKMARDSISFNEFLLRADPRNARAHSSLAQTLLLLGRMEEASRHLRQALILRPDFDEAHYFLGIIRRQEGRPDLARREFTETLRINPSHSQAHGNLGLISLEEGKLDDAVLEFQAALRIDPSDGLARRNLEEIQARRRTAPR